MAHDLDTSARVTLAAEPETDALRAWLGARDRVPVASDLARTELRRAVRRSAPNLIGRAREVFDSVTLVEVPTAILEAAGTSHRLRGRPSMRSSWRWRRIWVTTSRPWSRTTVGSAGRRRATEAPSSLRPEPDGSTVSG